MFDISCLIFHVVYFMFDILDMTVHLVLQKGVERMMISVVVGVPATLVVGGVWTDLKPSKTRTQSLRNKMTGD